MTTRRQSIAIFVRQSLTGYLAVSSFLLFFCALFLYYGLNPVFPIIASLVAITTVILGLNDRVSFDGRRLVMVGPIARLAARFLRSRRSLNLRSVETVETIVKRLIKRSGNFYYQYRVVFHGRGVEFQFDTSIKGHRPLVSKVLAKLPESILDIRSIELRDFLSETNDLLRQTRDAQIPPAEVLEGAMLHSRIRSRSVDRIDASADRESLERARSLQILGNRLRVSGRLLQSAEALRRALRMNPRDGWLLLDLGRCIEELAGASGDTTLARRSLAILRLAERRAGHDARLLERVADTYLLTGEVERAVKAYKRVTELVAQSYRSFKGLADAALYQGKLAHAVLHISAASRHANHPALRRWSLAEAEYLSRLNESDEYMDIEIGRLNLLNSLSRSARTYLRIGLWGLPMIMFGLIVGDTLITDIGWAVSAVAFIAWMALSVASRFFIERIPFEIVEEDE
jgi:tetratricopeptide (TPR) repeat protein